MSADTVVVVQGASGPDDVPGIERAPARVQIHYAGDAESLQALIPRAEVLLGWDFRDGALSDIWDRAERLCSRLEEFTRPEPLPWSTLLARRTRPPHHLATCRDTGSRQQIEHRYLPHAGDRAKYHADALASPPRRRKTRKRRRPRRIDISTRGGRHRRRSGNNHCRRRPRAGDYVGIPVRWAFARS